MTIHIFIRPYFWNTRKERCG